MTCAYYCLFSVDCFCRTSWLRKDLHIVLVHPQIPQNTGVETCHSDRVCCEVTTFFETLHVAAAISAHTPFCLPSGAGVHAFLGKMACATVAVQQLLMIWNGQLMCVALLSSCRNHCQDLRSHRCWSSSSWATRLSDRQQPPETGGP